jgi:hypothetical protein
MSLRDWLNNHWLVEHTPSNSEIRELFIAVEHDLIDCRAPELSPDWRMTIAYTAALRAATAALAASGYRPVREQQHYRVIQSLAFTIEADSDLIAEFDTFRKKRNITSYERIGIVSNSEADQMIELAERIRDFVNEWLEKKHPELLD